VSAAAGVAMASRRGRARRRVTHLDNPILLSTLSFHASAPPGYRCSECIGAALPCPGCYACFWFAVNPDREHAGCSYVRPG